VAARKAREAAEEREGAFLRALKAATERRSEASERVLMATEDVLSALPPLSVGPAPRCLAASADTIWLDWEGRDADARGLPLPPHPRAHEVPDKGEGPARAAHYYLSMRGGFRGLHIGQRVQVAYEPPKVRPKMEKRGDDDGDDDLLLQEALGPAPHEAKAADASGATGPSQGPKLSAKEQRAKARAEVAAAAAEAEAEAARRAELAKVRIKGPAALHDPHGADPLLGRRFFRGRIVRIHGGKGQGTFDVVYSDGAKGFRVPRHRIKPDEPPQWKLLCVPGCLACF